ncbi:MAG: hypothetical protein H7066_09415, partial [Cytophagaceae bacterium]|nr:hypothetical protein [Gemmatimonadaceae bacterium]
MLWLLANATAPIQYRAIKAFLPAGRMPSRLDGLTLTKEAAKLIVNQTAEGVWGSAIINAPIPGAKNPDAGIGTATAVHRLLELGWDRDSPPIHNARRPLFRLLAEDTDPNFLY